MSQCRRILQALQHGPKTSAQLALLALKYTGRISDLRIAGHKITAQRLGDGRWLYTLVSASIVEDS